MNHETAVSRRYANWIEIGFTRDEFVIDFGQEVDGTAALPHSGIVVTPRAAEAFVAALRRSLDEHHRRYAGENEP
jgi:hypothetical protein